MRQNLQRPADWSPLSSDTTLVDHEDKHAKYLTVSLWKIFMAPANNLHILKFRCWCRFSNPAGRLLKRVFDHQRKSSIGCDGPEDLISAK
jgi:hypothetical protein